MDVESADPAVLFELARDKLSTQLAFADVVDGKLQMVFGISAALVGILAAVLTFKQGALHDWFVGILTALSFICFIGTGLLAFGTGRGTGWEMGPDLVPGEIERFLGNATQNKLNAVKSLINYYNCNKPTYDSKTQRLLKSTRLLTCQTALLLMVAAKTSGLF